MDFNKGLAEINKDLVDGVASNDDIPALLPAPATAQNWPFTLLDHWQRTRRVDLEEYELL